MLLNLLDAQLKTQQNQRLRTESVKQRVEESKEGRKAEAHLVSKAFALYLSLIELGTLELKGFSQSP